MVHLKRLMCLFVISRIVDSFSLFSHFCSEYNFEFSNFDSNLCFVFFNSIDFVFLMRSRSPWEVHTEHLGLRGAVVGKRWHRVCLLQFGHELFILLPLYAEKGLYHYIATRPGISIYGNMLGFTETVFLVRLPSSWYFLLCAIATVWCLRPEL